MSSWFGITKKDKPPPKRVSVREIYAFQNVKNISSTFVATRKTLTDLDLSNNLISDVSPLTGLDSLESLVLDSNLITSHSRLPILPSLTTLWVNKNRISNLSLFVNQLAVSFPHLIYLSMLGNDARPNYINSFTP